jgi:iron complex outermembrane receptor protein
MKIRHKTASRAVLISSFASLLGLMTAQPPLAAEVQAAPVPPQVVDTKQDSAGGLEEIVVTAQKRTENIQRVPIAITALSGSDLESRGALDTGSLVKIVPGLNATMTAGYAGKLNFTLRGVGQNTFSEVQEAAIATYQDEFYVASAQGAEFSTFDNERVEVLRGPQGTLFGRSASGGLINFINRQPGRDSDGYLTVGVGSFGGRNVEAAQDVPLDKEGDNALRASARYNGSDGFMHSQTGGKNGEGGDSYAGRLQLRLQPSSELKLLLKAEYGKVDTDHGTAFKHINAYQDSKGNVLVLGPTQNIYGTPGGDLFGYRDTSSDYWSTASGPSISRTERELFTARADYDLGGATLTSLTGYMDIRGRYIEDTDGTPVGTPADFVFFDSHSHDRELTQEIRLSSNPAAHIQWTVGGFYFNYKIVQDTALTFPNGIVPFGLTDPSSYRQFDNQNRHSYAGFGQADIPLAPEVTLTVGGRVEREHADFTEHQVYTPYAGTLALNGVPPIDFSPALDGNLARIDKTYVSGGATLAYRPEEHVLLYTSLKRGIKPGGFNTPDTAIAADQMKFKEEKLDALDGGVKSDWFNQTLRLNASVYHYWYKDYQAVHYNLNTFTGNATARVRGIDVEAVWAPTRSTEVGVSGGYVDAVAEHIPLVLSSGVLYRDRWMPNAPKVPLNAYIRYHTDLAGGDLSFRIDEIYRSKTFYEIQDNPGLTQGAYHLEDLTVGWKKDDWSISATASNLFDTKYIAYMQDASAIGFIAATLGRPRMFTLQVTRNW